LLPERCSPKEAHHQAQVDQAHPVEYLEALEHLETQEDQVAIRRDQRDQVDLEAQEDQVAIRQELVDMEAAREEVKEVNFHLDMMVVTETPMEDLNCHQELMLVNFEPISYDHLPKTDMISVDSIHTIGRVET
jgi:hypothetical protein